MKNFTYLLPLLLVLALAAGCAKNSDDPGIDISNYPYPLGTFQGRFTRIHKNTQTLKSDTASCVITLLLSATTGYAVTGDTTTIHAGSYGAFSENAYNIDFEDATYPTSGFPVKTHLSNTYNYTFNNPNLIITGTDADSLSYTYNLVKIGN